MYSASLKLFFMNFLKRKKFFIYLKIEMQVYTIFAYRDASTFRKVCTPHRIEM